MNLSYIPLLGICILKSEGPAERRSVMKNKQITGRKAICIMLTIQILPGRTSANKEAPGPDSLKAMDASAPENTEEVPQFMDTEVAIGGKMGN